MLTRTAVIAMALGLAGSLVAFTAGGAAAEDAGCGLGTGEPATGAPILIGSVVGETGPDDFSAGADAARAYFACVNANGGINGRPIDFRVEDDQWNPEVAGQVAAKLVKDVGVVAMAGSGSFVEMTVNAKLYEDENLAIVASACAVRECFESRNIASTNQGPVPSNILSTQWAVAEPRLEEGRLRRPQHPLERRLVLRPDHRLAGEPGPRGRAGPLRPRLGRPHRRPPRGRRHRRRHHPRQPPRQPRRRLPQGGRGAGPARPVPLDRPHAALQAGRPRGARRLLERQGLHQHRARPLGPRRPRRHPLARGDGQVRPPRGPARHLQPGRLRLGDDRRRHADGDGPGPARRPRQRHRGAQGGQELPHRPPLRPLVLRRGRARTSRTTPASRW